MPHQRSPQRAKAIAGSIQNCRKKRYRFWKRGLARSHGLHAQPSTPSRCSAGCAKASLGQGEKCDQRLCVRQVKRRLAVRVPQVGRFAGVAALRCGPKAVEPQRLAAAQLRGLPRRAACSVPSTKRSLEGGAALAEAGRHWRGRRLPCAARVQTPCTPSRGGCAQPKGPARPRSTPSRS
jgi:hypothetical protein